MLCLLRCYPRLPRGASRAIGSWLCAPERAPPSTSLTPGRRRSELVKAIASFSAPGKLSPSRSPPALSTLELGSLRLYLRRRDSHFCTEARAPSARREQVPFSEFVSSMEDSTLKQTKPRWRLPLGIPVSSSSYGTVLGRLPANLSE